MWVCLDGRNDGDWRGCLCRCGGSEFDFGAFVKDEPYRAEG
jgi:hypothetical protein